MVVQNTTASPFRVGVRKVIFLLLLLLSGKVLFDLSDLMISPKVEITISREILKERYLLGNVRETLRQSSENNTIFVTSGNWGFRDMLQNVVLTSRKAYPKIKVVVVTLDEKTYEWCKHELKNSTCLSFNCSCPETKLRSLEKHRISKKANVTSGGYSQESAYTDCLIGIYICKLRVKLRILELGFNLLFIDGDAAIRPGGLTQVLSQSSLDVAGACEFCEGSCSVSSPQAKLIDGGKRVPHSGYWQVNIGLFWVNCTNTSLMALRQSIGVIVDNNIEFKSVDQTVLNRRLIALGAKLYCVPTGGLNIRSRSSKPKLIPNSWGVHAARLVSKTGFYKRAFLHHNSLWEVRPFPPNFEDRYRQWLEKPKQFKKLMKAAGEIEY